MVRLMGREIRECNSEELPTHGKPTIINGKVSSNVNGKMTIPDHATTSIYEFSVNHVRNVNKPNKEHKIMVVADSQQKDV
jgi:hypothetical protein